eukprot:9475453-Pyramimonas_sp.AAC.1
MAVLACASAWRFAAHTYGPRVRQLSFELGEFAVARAAGPIYSPRMEPSVLAARTEYRTVPRLGLGLCAALFASLGPASRC